MEKARAQGVNPHRVTSDSHVKGGGFTGGEDGGKGTAKNVKMGYITNFDR